MKIEDKKAKPFAEPNRDEIAEALKKFLAKGGRIRREEPLWIEEERGADFQPKN